MISAFLFGLFGKPTSPIGRLQSKILSRVPFNSLYREPYTMSLLRCSVFFLSVLKKRRSKVSLELILVVSGYWIQIVLPGFLLIFFLFNNFLNLSYFSYSVDFETFYLISLLQFRFWALSTKIYQNLFLFFSSELTFLCISKEWIFSSTWMS